MTINGKNKFSASVAERGIYLCNKLELNRGSFPLTHAGFEVILCLLEELKFIFNITQLSGRGTMSLLDALQNEMYRVEGIAGPADERRRLLDLGITPGEELAVVQSVPLGDPLVVMVRGMRLALRRREAGWISIQ